MAFKMEEGQKDPFSAKNAAGAIPFPEYMCCKMFFFRFAAA
jgi:hypothetical protein